MPNRVQWTPDYSVGNETLDNQHRNILAQCNALANWVAATDQEGDFKFHNIFNELIALAREHFASEEDLLTRCSYPLLEEHKSERDEFNYLVADIITTENFEKLELQRFLTLWWVGHIVGSGKKYRACIAGLPTG